MNTSRILLGAVVMTTLGLGKLAASENTGMTMTLGADAIIEYGAELDLSYAKGFTIAAGATLHNYGDITCPASENDKLIFQGTGTIINYVRKMEQDNALSSEGVMMFRPTNMTNISGYYDEGTVTIENGLADISSFLIADNNVDGNTIVLAFEANDQPAFTMMPITNLDPENELVIRANFSNAKDERLVTACGLRIEGLGDIAFMGDQTTFIEQNVVCSARNVHIAGQKSMFQCPVEITNGCAFHICGSENNNPTIINHDITVIGENSHFHIPSVWQTQEEQEQIIDLSTHINADITIRNGGRFSSEAGEKIVLKSGHKIQFAANPSNNDASNENQPGS